MNAPTDLTKWIQEHKVCWDLLPYYAVDGGPRIQIGFELDLFAQHLPSYVRIQVARNVKTFIKPWHKLHAWRCLPNFGQQNMRFNNLMRRSISGERQT